MKKMLGVLLVLVFSVFVSSTTFATEWYTVQVLNGSVDADQNGFSSLNVSSPPSTSVANLDSSFAPFVSVGTINDLVSTAPIPGPGSDGWNAAGWWTFVVTGSSGSGWNEVFGGGNYTFTADWSGLFNVHFGIPNSTFDAMYGKWSKNNDSVYTYFGLYVPPNTAGAQDPSILPIGIFAFLADDPLLYPSGFSLGNLYAATRNGPITIEGGTGRFEATSVPEPATMLLLGFGLVGLAGIRRKMS